MTPGRYFRQSRMRDRRGQPRSRSGILGKIILILLVAAIAVGATLLFSGNGFNNQGNFAMQRNAKLRSEVQRAVSSVNSLSNLGASSTSAMLGKIRQYIHGMEIVDDLNVGMYGESSRVYTASMFSDIYAIIDEYETRVASGQKLTEILDTLRTSVESLSEYTNTRLEAITTE